MTHKDQDILNCGSQILLYLELQKWVKILNIKVCSSVVALNKDIL